MEEIIERFSKRKAYISGWKEMNRSSVIIPIVEINNEPNIIFEVRAKKLKTQPGDICFPGGKIEETEEPIETALRETREELGLKDINIIKELDVLVKYNNIIIHNFLCIINDISELVINKEEVEEIFCVPVGKLLKIKPIETISKVHALRDDNFPYNLINKGKEYKFKDGMNKALFYKYDKYVIWGITGEILYNFLETLRNN
ncbi:MAG: CoA pyrophosphatase [Clostridiales bacterium]|nr:CoA pyrophosphatase [Clostridiales bacterium]